MSEDETEKSITVKVEYSEETEHRNVAKMVKIHGSYKQHFRE